MVRTITLNSGFDEIFTVSGLRFGGVSSLVAHISRPSGKGINAARVMRSLGVPVKAYALVGARDLSRFQALLVDEGIDAVLVPVEASTRRNLTLFSLETEEPAAHAGGTGFLLSSEEPINQILDLLARETLAGDTVILHGSTPAGLDVMTWCRIGQLAITKGSFLLADTHGEPLVALLGSLSLSVCKPNEEESRVISGPITVDKNRAVRAALAYMASHNVKLPVVTLGAEGIRFVVGSDIWNASYPISRPRIVVGAGDACMAGMAAAFHEGTLSPFEVIRRGVAAAVAHIEGVDLDRLASRVAEVEHAVQVRFIERM